MRIPRCYEPTLPQPAHHDPFALSEGVVQHICRALRLQAGERITLFNGNGMEYLCELTQVTKRSAQAKIINSRESSRTSPICITIGQSISRGERMDYAVQKATELGAAAIVPLFSERCEVRLGEDRQEKRRNHWQQVAISACEQSLRSTLPAVHSPCSLTEWISTVQADLKLVLHHHSQLPLQNLPPPDSIALLIGPEGGLSEQEVAQAQAAGFQAVTFGPRVLRTETAPVAALAILQYLWGDLG